EDLGPVAAPPHWTTEAPRRPGDQRRLHVERVARAEIAADIAGDYPHLFRPDVQNMRDLALLAHDPAAAMPHSEIALPVPDGCGGAGLHRHAGEPCHRSAQAGYVMRPRERRLDRCFVADLRIDADIARRFIPDLRRARLRR